LHRLAGTDGLLTGFIGEQLVRHVEPARLGTPRGAPVGFSRKKLAAALFALTSRDVKHTAKDLGVSYGVVRKWRTEVAFKALVERLEDEFIERFCRAVDADVGPLAVGPLDDVWAPPEGPGDSTPPADVGQAHPTRKRGGPRGAEVDQIIQMLHIRRAEWFATHLGDLRLYGPRLIGKLARHLLDEGDGAGRLGRMSVLQGLAELRHQAVPSPELQQLGVSALIGILRFIVRALESPTISEEHRTLARVYLGMLQWQLSDRRA
jgi:hypothetical protein